jgi:hypothetical protein
MIGSGRLARSRSSAKSTPRSGSSALEAQERPGGEIGDERAPVGAGHVERDDERERRHRPARRQRAGDGGDEDAADAGFRADPVGDLVLRQQRLDQPRDEHRQHDARQQVLHQAEVAGEAVEERLPAGDEPAQHGRGNGEREERPERAVEGPREEALVGLLFGRWLFHVRALETDIEGRCLDSYTQSVMPTKVGIHVLLFVTANNNMWIRGTRPRMTKAKASANATADAVAPPAKEKGRRAAPLPHAVRSPTSSAGGSTWPWSSPRARARIPRPAGTGPSSRTGGRRRRSPAS